MAGQGARFNPFFWTQGSLVPWGHGVQGQHPPTHGIFWTFRVWGEPLVETKNPVISPPQLPFGLWWAHTIFISFLVLSILGHLRSGE
jgi:hypothetical protein